MDLVELPSRLCANRGPSGFDWSVVEGPENGGLGGYHGGREVMAERNGLAPEWTATPVVVSVANEKGDER